MINENDKQAEQENTPDAHTTVISDKADSGEASGTDDVSLDTPSEETHHTKANTSAHIPIGAEDVELEHGGLSQDFEEEAETAEVDSHPKIQKPHKGMMWFHVSPKAEHRMHVAIHEKNDGSKTTYYIVAKSMLETLLGDWNKRVLYLCQTEEGKYFWWPVKSRDGGGDLDDWNESAHRTIHDYPNRFLRRLANKRSSYNFRVASPDKTPPSWDTVDLADLKSKTLQAKDVVIRDSDHPVVHEILKG